MNRTYATSTLVGCVKHQQSVYLEYSKEKNAQLSLRVKQSVAKQSQGLDHLLFGTLLQDLCSLTHPTTDF